MPMISVFIFWFFKKQRPSFYTLVFIGLAFVGVFLVVTNGDISVFTSTSNQLIPVIILFIAVIGWVVYTMGGGVFPTGLLSAIQRSLAYMERQRQQFLFF